MRVGKHGKSRVERSAFHAGYPAFVMIKTRIVLTACGLVSLCAAANPLEIRFTTPPASQPAKAGNKDEAADSKNYMGEASNFPSSNWSSQAQPVGNGRIGAMVFGNPLAERIQFNDITLWTGGDNLSGEYKHGEFGSYQNFGDLRIRMNAEGGMGNFSRSLDLATGIHTTSWKQGEVIYTREVLASKPDEAIVVRMSANQPGKVSGMINLTGSHGETTAATGDTLTFGGALDNGLRYAARVTAVCEGGTAKAEGDVLQVSGNAVTLVLTAATDYALDPAKKFRSGIDPVITVAGQAAKAAAKTHAALRSAHVDDFTKLMGRVSLDVGEAPAGKSVTERLAAYKAGAADNHLEALMFHYGRYLIISSSRGSLPANLQGLWNDSNKPAWYADYHTNINIQMNYWLTGPANLTECAQPLFDWTLAMIPGSRAAFVKEFGENVPGWTMRTSVNTFGGNGWKWNLPASAWLAQHFWEQYAFTGDREFLEKTAWPVFVDVCALWLHKLKEVDGKLVVPDGWSPEHGPREDGVAHDQQLVWDLFTNTIEAAGILGKSDPLVGKIKAAREKLLGPQIGSWGQIMEWTTERPELEKSGHRHSSHLFGLHPGRQFTSQGTSDLFKAAAVSLEARGTSGDSRRSWTWPWRMAMWGRLGRPDKAGEMMRGLLVHNTLDNLFTSHPPFQIDGNLGITAGVCETLLHSHEGEISILPAPPVQWKSGSFRGLLARGGFEVDATWKDGKLVSSRLLSKLGNPAVLRMPDGITKISLASNDGAPVELKANDQGQFNFKTKPGAPYTIVALE
jgi:alpha-L-fucosidase 2